MRRRLALPAPSLASCLGAVVAALLVFGIGPTARARSPLAALPAASVAGTQVSRLPTSQRVVALTFDAGSGGEGVTSILATLQREGVPATFFLTGDWVQRFPALTSRIAADPSFAIGNHTFDHPHMPKLSDAAVTNEVVNARTAILGATGRDPRPLFRFPYGEYDSRTLGIVSSLGYTSFFWTVDSLGWQGTSAGQSVSSVVSRAVGAATPGEIVLMHTGAAPDRSTLDADALPQVIAGLRARGYGFVSLDSFYGIDNLARPAQAMNTNGTLQVFARTAAGRVLTSWQGGPSAGFGGWLDMGLPAVAAGTPAVGVNQSGALQLFVRTVDGRLLTSWQAAPSQGFGGWADLGLGGQLVSDPTAVRNANGTVQVFLHATGGRIVTTWQVGPNQGFGGWLDMGLNGTAGGVPAVAVNQNGALQILARTTDDRLLTSKQAAPNQGFGAWTDVSAGNQIVSDPALGLNTNGTLQAFARAGGGKLLTTWQTGPNQAFGGWLDLLAPARTTGTAGVGTNLSGALQVFARTTDHRLVSSWQGGPSSPFGGWADLGAAGLVVSDPTLARNTNGTMQVFVRGPGGGLLTSWQVGPNQGFGGWLDMRMPV